MYSDSEDNIKVVLRIRPFNKRESDENSNGCIIESEENPDKQFYFGTGEDSKEFNFDYVAGQESTQQQIFQIVGQPLADFALDGYNVCIFAYGQTGTGKTHTMYGKIGDDEQEGLQTRILKKCFNDIDNHEKDVQFITYAHYFEIYNENIIDLLSENMNEEKKDTIQIREDVKKGVYVENLQCKYIQDYTQAMELLQEGNKQRHVAATKMNLESSRSHSIFQFHIQQKTIKNGITNFKASKINFVDLAGSERQKNTQAQGERLKEATNINKSLSILGRVINQLVEKMQKKKTLHIPYRDSKLTFLLKDSLGGNAKTLMIATITASDLAFQETLSTLKFAQRAKMIKNQAEKNEESTGSLKLLQKEIKLLKQQIEMYKQKISQYENNQTQNDISFSNPENNNNISTNPTERLNTVENELNSTNQNELDLLSEIQNLKDQLSLKEHELSLEQIKYQEKEFDFQHQVEKNKQLEKQVEELQQALQNSQNNEQNQNQNPDEVDFMKKSVFEQTLEQKLANLQSENEFLNKKLEKFYLLQEKFMGNSKLQTQSMIRFKESNNNNNNDQEFNQNENFIQNQSIIKEEDPFLNLMTQNDELRNKLNEQIDDNNELKTELAKINEDNDTLRQTIFYISSQLNQARKEKKNDNISNIHFQRKTYSVASFTNNGDENPNNQSKNDDSTLNDILNQMPNDFNDEGGYNNTNVDYFQYYSNFKYQVLIDSIQEIQKFHTDKNAIVHNHFTVYLFIVWQNPENQKLLVKHFKHFCKKIHLQHNLVINMMGNNLNDENMQRICLQGLKYFEKIKKLNLNLSHNMISNDGLEFLCQALKSFQKLQELTLNLQYNEAINEQGFHQLMLTIKQIPTLSSFELIRDKINIKINELQQEIKQIGVLEHQQGFKLNIKPKVTNSSIQKGQTQQQQQQPVNQMSQIGDSSHKTINFDTRDQTTMSKFRPPQKRSELIDHEKDESCKMCQIF